MTEARLTVTDQTDGSTGLLGYLLSDEVWATLPGKRRDDGTVVLPFDIDTTIANPAQGATTLQVKLWESLSLRKKEVISALNLFTAKLTRSIPATDLSELQDPTFGLMFVTAKDIFAHVRARYSVLNAEDFNTLYARFALLKTSTEEIATVAERHREGHAICAAAGQPMNEHGKCSAFKTAISSDPTCRHAIQSYTQNFPLLPDQTFAELVQHVLLHAPNYVATTADLGFALAATIVAPTSVPARGRGGRGGRQGGEKYCYS
jgi:hypothetical protein